MMSLLPLLFLRLPTTRPTGMINLHSWILTGTTRISSPHGKTAEGLLPPRQLLASSAFSIAKTTSSFHIQKRDRESPQQPQYPKMGEKNRTPSIVCNRHRASCIRHRPQCNHHRQQCNRSDCSLNKRNLVIVIHHLSALPICHIMYHGGR